ncbi:MAG: Sir2 family NAD+-dependent deacetylase [Planctomycetota bacterium]|jgi:NAD-dependent deacetylase
MSIHKTAASRIVVLTGAGISAESGLKTFRDAGGLWEQHRIQDVASPRAFARDPALVQRFYNLRRAQLLSEAVQPNPAHRALAAFEDRFGGEFLLVTQNVDDLHERGGSKNLLHMHGELLKMRCTASDQAFEIREPIATDARCACCDLEGTLRPHIVWFGETPMHMRAIEDALSRCDLFVAIGTSGRVYPAAGFVRLARHAGARTIEINLERSDVGGEFDAGVYGKASAAVPAFFASVDVRVDT